MRDTSVTLGPLQRKQVRVIILLHRAVQAYAGGPTEEKDYSVFVFSLSLFAN